MNLSSAVMLVEKTIRPVRVEYDPDIAKNNAYNRLYKTLDATIKVGDLVIVQTSTRHGFTIAKVTEVDFAVDFNAAEQWGWIGGKFDKPAFDTILETEKQIIGRVAKAQENKMRAELVQAMGIGETDFKDLNLLGASPAEARPVVQPVPPADN